MCHSGVYWVWLFAWMFAVRGGGAVGLVTGIAVRPRALVGMEACWWWDSKKKQKVKVGIGTQGLAIAKPLGNSCV